VPFEVRFLDDAFDGIASDISLVPLLGFDVVVDLDACSLPRGPVPGNERPQRQRGRR
jgi:hypothetical protein